MLSPVCTPTGSTFSILQTVIQLPAPSRITSYSISFHPAMQRSTKTSPTLLKRRPFDKISINSCSLCAIPPPLPPNVNAGRSTTGYPMVLVNRSPSSIFFTTQEAAQGSPIFSIVSLNAWRSSALKIVSAVVPISLTPCPFKNPDSSSSIPRFNPACPPKVGSMLSGFSFLIISSRTDALSGSIYTSSAISLSVIIVAGLELTRTTSTPSSFSDLQACVPA